MPPVWASVPRDVGSSNLRRTLLMWQGRSFFCSVWTWSALFKTEFPRAGCILMLMLRDLLDLSAKTCFFKKRHFSSLQFCHSLFCPTAVMDGTCLIQFVSQDWFVFLAEGKETGEGWEKIRKGGWGLKIQIICKKPCDLISLESLACPVWVWVEMGELLEGLQRAQHSEAALWGLGTWERNFTKWNSLHLLSVLLLSSRSDFNGYLFPACFIEWLLKKPAS